MCVVEGVTTDANTVEVLRKTTVHLSPLSSSDAGYAATTDASGHFRFENVRGGDYRLEGERPGYLNSNFGARKPGGIGTMLHLNAGDKLSDLQVKLWPRCVVSGKVLDENGEPVSAQISAVSQMWFRGQKQYFANWGSSTDDAGEYRMSGLEPGRYFLYASPQSEKFVEEQGKPEKCIVPVFYPDSQTLENATAFELRPGQDISGVNFRMHTASVFHVRGKVNVSPLRDREDLQVTATRHGLVPDLSELESEIKRDGSFDISGVPAGSYDLRICGGWEHRCLGNVAVDIASSDVSGVVMHLPNLFAVKGTVRESGTDGRSFAGTQISLAEAGTALNEGYRAAVEPDSTFTFRDVSAGEYVVSVYLPGQADYVKSILYGQKEMLGEPIDFSAGAAGELQIVVSKGVGQVEGTVQMPDPQENRSENASFGGLEIVLVSKRPRLENEGVVVARTDQNGHFSIKKGAAWQILCVRSRGRREGSLGKQRLRRTDSRNRKRNRGGGRW